MLLHTFRLQSQLVSRTTLVERPRFEVVDIAARLGELGRQPYAARAFLTRYQDRVPFGSDLGPDLASYRLSYRFLETDDEYFSYGVEDPPPQGRWRVHGLHLPDDVLGKIYSANARHILSPKEVK